MGGDRRKRSLFCADSAIGRVGDSLDLFFGSKGSFLLEKNRDVLLYKTNVFFTTMKHEIKKVLSLSLWGLCGVIAVSFIAMITSCGGGGRHGGGWSDSDGSSHYNDHYDCGRDERNQWRLDHPNTPNTPPPFPIPDHINNRIPR